MKKSFLLFALCILLIARAFALADGSLTRKLDFSTRSETLDITISRLKATVPGLTFNFRTDELRKIKLTSKEYKDKTVGEILNDLLKNSGFEYEEKFGTIIIYKVQASKEVSSAPAQQQSFEGTISDTQGPMAGVTVRNKTTGAAMSTDIRGTFRIAAKAGDLVSFSMLGYRTQEIKVTSSRQNIVMQIAENSLDEVVVIGYGTMKKSDLSAAASTVRDVEQSKSRPVLNVANMMQGKVPGITVVNQGGHPNGAPSITIRGVGSLREDVLFVVDGVPGAPYNPADVESVTILKDAASAAIYGAFSGSAGVVLITTKQAGKGEPGVQYEAFTGAKTAWRLPQSLTAEEEARVSNLAYTNAGKTPLDGWDVSKNPYAQVTRTDWIDEIFRTGIMQRHNISINAGTDKFATLLQGRYEKDEGTLLNTYNKNLSLRLNANYKLTDKLKLRQELFYNNNDNRGTSTSSGYSGSIVSAIYMPRSATVYYEDGTFGGVGPRDSKYLGIHGDAINPVATLLRNDAYNRTNDLQSVTELSYSDIVPGLSYLTRFSYRQWNVLFKNFEPKRIEPGNDQNSLSNSTDRNYHGIWENTVNYNRSFGRHSLGAMASITLQEEGGRGFSASARGFEREDPWARFFINASVFDQDRPTDYEFKDRNASYVTRLSYSWANRYFVTGSYRYDIAGRLPAQYRGTGLPGVTAAWKLSSEPFFNVKAIDLLKFRASWGRIGNLGTISRYYGYAKLSSNTTYQIGNQAPISNALYIDNLFNPTLTWESSEQTDIGMDLSLMKEKLTITADYFNKLTFDLIKDQDTGWPNTFGLGAPTINQGEIRNKGFEFSANWNAKAGELTYNVGANFAAIKNRVEYIDDNPNSVWPHGDAWRGILVPFRSKVGEPYYSYWLIRNGGIFQSDEAAAAYVGSNGQRIQPNAKAGDLKFIDQNNDGKIDDLDRVYMGSAMPKFTYGFTANASWKNFDLSLFFQGVAGVKLFHAFKQSTLNGGEQGYNRWNKILDAWSETNRDSDIPRINIDDPNRNFSTSSDWYLEKGDYLRLKNAMIGYTFNKLPGKMKLRVFISGENLLTFTDYTGMDPEVGGLGLDGGQYPVSRIYSAGVRLSL